MTSVAPASRAFFEAVDRDDALGPQHDRAGDREEPDGARTPDGHDVAGLDVAQLGAHVPRGKDVRQEEDLVVGEVLVLDLDRTDVGERHPGELGLTARVAAGHRRVAEDPRGRMAPHLLGHPGVRVGVLAAREEPSGAHAAAAARDRERHDDAIAHPEAAHALADFHDLAHELVPQDVALGHRGDVAVVEVQVRSADRRRGDPHDGVTVREEPGVGNLLDLDGVASAPTGGTHQDSSVTGWAGCRLCMI